MTVAVFGLGYVGCVTAACLAHLGHRVTGVDRDSFKVDCVRAGRAPFYEPGLEELVRETVRAGRLRATTVWSEGLAGAELALVCVGTPSDQDGNLDLDQLRRVSHRIGSWVAHSGQPVVVAVRSTVYPGTCEEVVRAAMPAAPYVPVVSHPEFLREGSAVADFLHPSLLVVGGSDADSVARVAALYDGLPVIPTLVGLRTGELIKYACNAFHAVKIAFANEMGALAAGQGIDGAEVMEALCRDEVLNLSRAYLKPGFAFGGSCLAKDLRAVVYRAGRLGLKLPLVESVLPSNATHLERAIRQALALPPGRLGVFGLAFKENTDDLRESAVVQLLAALLAAGRQVRVYDPHVRLGAIYGSNARYLVESIPPIGSLLEDHLDHLVEWAEHIVLAQKPAPEMLARLRESGKTVLDLVGARE